MLGPGLARRVQHAVGALQTVVSYFLCFVRAHVRVRVCMCVRVCVCFGRATRLAGSQFPNQGVEPGPRQ